MFSSSSVQGTSNDSAIERYVAKPITVGAAGYALSKVIMPSLVDTNWSRTLTFDQGSMLARFSGKREISMPVLAALAVGLGSVLSEVAHEFVFPHIHYLEKNGEPSALAINFSCGPSTSQDSASSWLVQELFLVPGDSPRPRLTFPARSFSPVSVRNGECGLGRAVGHAAVPVPCRTVPRRSRCPGAGGRAGTAAPFVACELVACSGPLGSATDASAGPVRRRWPWTPTSRPRHDEHTKGRG